MDERHYLTDSKHQKNPEQDKYENKFKFKKRKKERTSMQTYPSQIATNQIHFFILIEQM